MNKLEMLNLKRCNEHLQLHKSSFIALLFFCADDFYYSIFSLPALTPVSFH